MCCWVQWEFAWTPVQTSTSYPGGDGMWLGVMWWCWRRRKIRWTHDLRFLLPQMFFIFFSFFDSVDLALLRVIVFPLYFRSLKCSKKYLAVAFWRLLVCIFSTKGQYPTRTIQKAVRCAFSCTIAGSISRYASALDKVQLSKEQDTLILQRFGASLWCFVNHDPSPSTKSDIILLVKLMITPWMSPYLWNCRSLGRLVSLLPQ